MNLTLFRIILFLFLVGVIGCSTKEKVQLPETVTFNKHIRPVFSQTCFVCHGPDVKNNPSKLRLDIREVAIAPVPRKDYIAIVPGKPEESEMIRRLRSEDPEVHMPPPDFHHRISDYEIALIEKWIKQGAEYEQHWAYTELKRPEVPEVADAANPIDSFILTRLKEEKVAPSERATKRILLRRLSFDLIGLPPEPEEMRAFLEDKSEDAYEKQVDRLLASLHYGERMAVPWLDIVRYADTVGYHGDQTSFASPYRDYVINAFNKNKPFDQFTREQLAGDLLEDPTEEQLVASCFNRLNMTTEEGGSQAKEYLNKYAGDRVRTISMAWLGSTMGCTECHDHKFDPFKQKDFYRMQAFFAGIEEEGVYDGKRGLREPVMEVVDPELSRIRQGLITEEAESLAELYEADLDELKAAEQKWIQSMKASLGDHQDGWYSPKVIAASTEKKTVLTIQEDNTVLASKGGKSKEVYTIELELKPGQVQAIKLEVYPHESFKGKLSKEGQIALGKLDIMIKKKDKPGKPKAIHWAKADYQNPNFNFHQTAGGHLGREGSIGWVVSDKEEIEKPHHVIVVTEKPIDVKAGQTLSLKMYFNIRKNDKGSLGHFKVSVSTLPKIALADPDVAEVFQTALSKAENKRTEEESAVLDKAYRYYAPELKELQEKLLEAQKTVMKSPEVALVMYTKAVDPRDIRVLHRGDWMDETGEIVLPGVPEFFAQIDKEERATRLDLAEWLTSAKSPLTSRSYVNRLWKQFFGIGLSNILDDLGSQGEWPSHPELIDWLAIEFIESGWDMKHMVKLIVMSDTYCQNSDMRDDLKDKDPYNRLLARQSYRRLDAEFVRDNLLAVSGLLYKEIGGISAKPYQPEGYYAQLNFPKRTYKPSTDHQQWRRGVYTHWQRTFLHPAMAAFDASSREECAADRPVSNTPMQALALLNDPTSVEAARMLAGNILKLDGEQEFGERLDWAFERVLNRPFKEKEKEKLKLLYDSELARYAEDEDAAKETISIGDSQSPESDDLSQHAAWTSVSRVLLNLHETITRY